MAGNPLQKLLPYGKKYGVEIYCSLGFALAAYMKYQISKVYKNVYSEYDFQRRLIVESAIDILKTSHESASSRNH
jgi:hypothetical protein